MTVSTPKSERRRKARRRPLSLVYVELASANGGMMRDLSEEGFAVRAMMPVRAGEKTPFSFSLNNAIRIDGEGEILWIEENGRVAGVQFIQISAKGREQIREWLSRPEEPPSRDEGRGRGKATDAPTLEELREEIHSVPSRAEQASPQAEPAPPPVVETAPARIEPEPVAVPPRVPAVALEEIRPSKIEEPAPAATEMLQPRETPPATSEAPALPPLSLTPKGVDPLFHPAVSPTGALREKAVYAEPAMGAELPAMADRNLASGEAAPALPDISTVLMQPSGRQSSAAPRSPYAEDLTAWRLEPAAHGRKWLDGFSISKAITLMVILTMIAAVVVFHRNAGQGLIWLGEELGGTEQIPPQTRALEGAVSNSRQVGSVGSHAAPPIATEDSAPRERDSGQSGASSVNNPQISLPAAAKNPLPPGAPLSGISGNSVGNGSEAGRDEYLQAMEILRSKNPGADTSEGLRLLWLAVEKGNPSAELALADMYWHGRGVARNCAQTRVLLTAAARKGSAEAQKRLQQFQQEGCE